MPAKLQEMIGYFVHKPNLGSINGRPPLDFVTDPTNPKPFTEYLPEAAKPFVRAFRRGSLSKAAA